MFTSARPPFFHCWVRIIHRVASGGSTCDRKKQQHATLIIIHRFYDFHAIYMVISQLYIIRMSAHLPQNNSPNIHPSSTVAWESVGKKERTVLKTENFPKFPKLIHVHTHRGVKSECVVLFPAKRQRTSTVCARLCLVYCVGNATKIIFLPSAHTLIERARAPIIAGLWWYFQFS